MLKNIYILILTAWVVMNLVCCGGGSGTSSPPPTNTPITTAPADTTHPTKPTGLAAITITSNSIKLSWNSSTDNVGVVDYVIYGRQWNLTGSPLRTGTSLTTTYTDTGLSAYTPYIYAVRARDAAGNVSPDSDGVVVETLP